MTSPALAYHSRATAHRPTNREELHREIRRMHTELGLHSRDIERALHVGPATVAEALGSGGTDHAA